MRILALDREPFFVSNIVKGDVKWVGDDGDVKSVKEKDCLDDE